MSVSLEGGLEVGDGGEAVGLLLMDLGLVFGKECVVLVESFEDEGEVLAEFALDHFNDIDKFDLLLG